MKKGATTAQSITTANAINIAVLLPVAFVTHRQVFPKN